MSYLQKCEDHVVESIHILHRYTNVEYLADMVHKLINYNVVYTQKEVGGMYIQEDREIHIHEGYAYSYSALPTLLHEIGHYYQFEKGLYNTSNINTIWNSEQQAERFAYNVCKRLEHKFDVSILLGYQMAYTKQWEFEWLKEWYSL